MSEITKIILDCDPGHDDAVAIMLAAGSPKIELLGITTESGNQTIEKTSRNALKVLQWIGRGDIPVYMGCKGPMVREKMTAADIHGETGLDGPAFPEITLKLQEKHAVQYIVETLMASEEPITMVTTGPMTNLGMAIRMEPAIVEKIDKIVLMGGSYQ
ncbi:MAG: nucleoside hydrolase, partial [Firmicutes bacterium]|nr:nucleoside hydrolase [Bacillota bacterium]